MYFHSPLYRVFRVSTDVYIKVFPRKNPYRMYYFTTQIYFASVTKHEITLDLTSQDSSKPLNVFSQSRRVQPVTILLVQQV